MRSTVKGFKELLQEQYKEGVDRVRRRKRGYTDEETNDDYHDVSEEFDIELDLDDDEEKKEEGVKQSQRDAYGYDLEEPTDYDVAEELELEVAPPSDEAEEFIQKNKKKFAKRYGARGKEVLYKTAWDKFGVGKNKNEAPMPPMSSLAQKGASQIQKGQGLGDSKFSTRFDAALDAFLGSFRSDTERRSAAQMMKKPEIQQKFQSLAGAGLPTVQPDTPQPGEDPRKWKLDHRQLESLMRIFEEIKAEFPLEGEDDKE